MLTKYRSKEIISFVKNVNNFNPEFMFFRIMYKNKSFKGCEDFLVVKNQIKAQRLCKPVVENHIVICQRSASDDNEVVQTELA